MLRLPGTGVKVGVGQHYCHHGLGTLALKLGRLEQARIALATASKLYRAMEMTLWLPQADATLVRAGESGETR